MSIDPSLHLHFEIRNDCTSCCPRILRCCCCDDGEANEFIAKKNGKLVPVAKASPQKRATTNARLYRQILPSKLGPEAWQSIEDKVAEISGLNFDAEIKECAPLTQEKLSTIAHAVDLAAKERGVFHSGS